MTVTTTPTEAFQSWLADNGASPETVRAYRADLAQMFAWLGDEDLTEETAARFLTTHRSTWSASTTGRKLSSIRSFMRHQGQPAFLSSYRPPTPAKAQPHPITEGIEGVLAMIAATNKPKRRALIALCGLCGLRVAEACAVTVDDFDLANDMLRVHGKGAKERDVPVSATAWKYIEPAYRAMREKPGTLIGLGPHGAGRVVSHLARVASLQDHVSSHQLRATFATAALELTGDITAVQDLLGHAKVDTTRRYTLTSTKRMRAATEVA